MPSNPVYDSAIIGGGLAGSAIAILLARQGKRVCLVEKSLQAHHKVCGEFLSYEAQYYLGLLNVNLQTLGAVPIYNVRLCVGKAMIETPLPFTGMSLSRTVLDEHLLNLAQLHGVKVKRGMPARAEPVKKDEWAITVKENEKILASKLFVATGKHDLAGYLPRTGQHNDYLGFKMYFKLEPKQSRVFKGSVEIFLFKGGYAGLEAVEGGLFNLCMVVHKNKYAACGKQWNTLLDCLLNENPHLLTRLAGADACWPKPLAIFKIPYGYVYRDERSAVSPFYRLGDQMAVIPSFCGDGMAIALHTAFMASQHSDVTSYHDRAYKELNSQVNLASALFRWSAYPLAPQCMLAMFRAAPYLMGYIARKTRITGPLITL